MNEIEQRVLDAIDVEGMLAYLCQLIAVPSLGGEETEAQEHVAAQMERCGLALDVWYLDFAELSQHPAFSIEIEREHALGVVGVMGEDREDGRSLIMNGHIDVVPAGEVTFLRSDAGLSPVFSMRATAPFRVCSARSAACSGANPRLSPALPMASAR